jgi:hypothetical protein
MKTPLFAVSLALCLPLVARAQDGGSNPQDAGVATWFFAGAPGGFETGTGPGTCGARVAWLRSTGADAGLPSRTGTVMQLFSAEKFRGKRLRFEGVAATRDVVGGASLWMRVDAAGKRTVAFDDMKGRALTGTRACAKTSVVLDVAPEAETIAMGLRLEGTGQVELAAIDLSAVDPHVPTTDQLHRGPPENDPRIGRVGDVWFSDRVVNLRAGVEGAKQRDGVWSGTFDAEYLDGHVDVRSHTAPREGSFTVRRDGDATVIEGTWGAPSATYPVTIRYTRLAIDMKWGFYERHLKQEDAPQEPEGCIYYSERAVSRQSDSLDLCDAVLDARPPPVQTVLAFLFNGFRRAMSPAPQ